MEENIVYGSVAHAPSVRYADEGQMEMLLNLVREDEALRPVLDGTTLMTYSKNLELLYYHKYNQQKNYVFRRTNADGTHSVVYLRGADAPRTGAEVDESKLVLIHTFEEGVEVQSVASVGYVLVIVTSVGLQYAMLKEAGVFEFMGLLPELPKVEATLDLGLMQYDELISKEGTDVTETKNVEDVPHEDIQNMLDGKKDNLILKKELRNRISDVVFAQVNTLRHEIHKMKRFCFPFYVRLAYKMYDGTTFAVSPPMLMITNSAMKPFSLMDSISTANLATFTTVLPSCGLNLRYKDIDEKWRGVLSSVEIYITKEIVDYSDDNNSIKCLIAPKNENAFQMSAFMIGKQAPDNIKAEEKIIELWKKSRKYVSLIGRFRHWWHSDKSSVGESYRCRYIVDKRYVQSEDGSVYVKIYLPHMDVALGKYKLDHIDENEVNKWKSEIGLTDDIDNCYVYEVPKEIVYEETDIKNNKTEIGSVQPPANIEATKVMYRENGVSNKSVFAWVDFEKVGGQSGMEEIKKSSSFFKIASINLEEQGYGEFEKPIEELIERNTLDNVETLPILEDRTVASYRFTSDAVKVDNNRLSVVVKEQEFPVPMIQKSTSNIMNGLIRTFNVWIKIVEDGTTYYVPVDNSFLTTFAIRHIFYPYSKACSMVMYYKKAENIHTLDKYAYWISEIPLQKHETLNGVYALNAFGVLAELENIIAGDEEIYTETMPEDVQKILDEIANSAHRRYVGNKIYQSEVANPFAFLNRTTSTINCSKIMAIETLSTPLSTGQFGDFQMVVFTDNGLWAVKTGDDGAITGAKDVISDDVMLEGTSVSNVDGELLYATNRGIMSFSSGKPVCISDNLRVVGRGDSLDNYAGLKAAVERAGIDTKMLEVKDVRDFCKERGFGVARDNRNQQLIFFNAVDPWCFVYSLLDKSWGVKSSQGYENTLNSYPECWIECVEKPDADEQIREADASRTGATVAGKRRLVKMDERVEENRDVFLMTRPIRGDQSGAMKTLRQLIQRGEFARGSVKTAVYGSNDCREWALVASSVDERVNGVSGSAYKYFIVVGFGELEPTDCIAGVSMEVEPKTPEKLA